MAQSVGSFSLDAESVQCVVRDLGKSRRVGRAEESVTGSRGLLAVRTQQGAPLPVCLEAGDALAENRGQEFVVHGVARTEGERAEPPAGIVHRIVARLEIRHAVLAPDDVEGTFCEPPGAVTVRAHTGVVAEHAGDVQCRGAVGCHGCPPEVGPVECDRGVVHPLGEHGEGVPAQRAGVSEVDGKTIVVARCGMAEIEISHPRNGIALVTMNRPDKLNAMTSEMVEQLHSAFDALGRNRDVRVIVLTGAGRGFCAGLDLGGYGDAPGFEWHGAMEKGLAVQKHIASLIPHMRSLPQPVIAAVNGPAAGGGFALVLGSDIRLCARSARFNAAFIRIGLSACDIGTSWLLPRLVGASRAQELMLTGRLFDADEAERIGLVVESFPDDVLLDAAFAKAEEIMLNTPIGVALTKEGMWTALEIPGLQAAIDLENRQQIMASFSDDAREMRRARAEGRPPTFTA